MNRRMLITNMGSTSTKVAVYDGETMIWNEGISHPREEIAKFSSPNFMDQYDYRKKCILECVKSHDEDLSKIAIFVSRGGTVRPVPGGVWLISEDMLKDAQSGKYGVHPCNIGGQIAYDMAQEYGIEAVTVDPPICDEMWEEATYSGHPEIWRYESFQQLNHRAIARKYSKDCGVPYEDLNLIVVHLGGGITVAAHCKGKITDVNNGLCGDGAFTLERTGSLPAYDLAKLCYSGKYTKDEMLKSIHGSGGMYAYIGVADGKQIDELIAKGDQKATSATKAMAYQTAKEIGAIAAAMSGKVDAILLTAGMAYWKYFTDLIIERISFIAPVKLYPGENEMESLALGTNRYLNGEEKAQVYTF